MDQGGGGGEALRHPALAGGQAQPQGHVGLAGAAVANGDDVLPPLDVLAAGQFHHQGLVHRGDGRKVEGVQAFDGGEAGGADPPLHHALVAGDEFEFRQPEQVLGVVHPLGGTLCHHFRICVATSRRHLPYSIGIGPKHVSLPLPEIPGVNAKAVSLRWIRVKVGLAQSISPDTEPHSYYPSVDSASLRICLNPYVGSTPASVQLHAYWPNHIVLTRTRRSKRGCQLSLESTA